MHLFNKKVLISALTLLIGVTIISNEALAQETGAKLSGQVIDASTQEVLSGVEITVQGEDMQKTSGDDGTFSFKNLKPGSYTVTANAEGYQDWEQEVEVTKKGGALKIEMKPAGS
ncbi:carboxypeptidase-like regulatory domain-containing protein [Fodinibius sp. Rm-B-1B1-1]|uniref:carboxypeptidase-like regulatory domain-containing protein n=1 Tax=Fodinibius alkaliphilus TaxID=3140241 RepID=UPI00315B13CE